MFKKVLLTAAIVVGTAASVYADTSETEKTMPWLGCHAKAQLEKVLADGQYVSFSRGRGPDGRANELWLNDSGVSVVIAFKVPKDGEAKNIDQVCVLNVTRNTVYNGDILESLGKSTDGSKL